MFSSLTCGIYSGCRSFLSQGTVVSCTALGESRQPGQTLIKCYYCYLGKKWQLSVDVTLTLSVDGITAFRHYGLSTACLTLTQKAFPDFTMNLEQRKLIWRGCKWWCQYREGIPLFLVLFDPLSRLCEGLGTFLGCGFQAGSHEFILSGHLTRVRKEWGISEQQRSECWEGRGFLD